MQALGDLVECEGERHADKRCEENVDNEIIARAFCANDAWAVALIRGVARPLGQMLASIHTATGVERFVMTRSYVPPGVRVHEASICPRKKWSINPAE